MKMVLLSCCLLTTLLSAIENTDKIASAAHHSYANRSENWIFSPFSMASCFSMIYAGSEGNTAAELKQALHLTLSQEKVGPAFQAISEELLHEPASPEDSGLKLAQILWIKKKFSFQDQFLKKMKDYFHANIEEVESFSAKIPAMNSWIAKETEGKIQNLFCDSDFDENTRLVAANALYFQGKWIFPFSDSSKAPFTTTSGVVHPVSMMHQTNRFPYFEDDTLQAVLLPFSTLNNQELACLLFLPKQTFSLEKMGQILDSMELQLVQLEVPKFEFDTRIDLESLLREWGAATLFSHEADFSGMDGKRDLFLSKALQKSFISFNEKGVEAAAATAAMVGMKCFAPLLPSAKFIANRPFDFLILEKNSHTTLFVGHVETP